MGWAQIITLIGVNIALVAAMVSIVIWIATKHDGDIKKIENRLDGHATRIDQLYQMFYNLLKEVKK